ncbi:MAG: ParB/RepB/Spo0J family partition protein [Erysipelotrichaceae bacterium]|nr:ParB/RepB/Spo0J family partition protein [Erysipelotrichaceae bacterium]
MNTVDLDISLIHPNPYQPRLEFELAALEELSLSIQENGLLQPIVVREVYNGYEIIAGERRFRACRMAGLETVPCRIMEANEMQTATMALVENIQREDLNAIEEAKAYIQMMRLNNLTQEELAKKVGKKQSTIANKIRLINLTEEVQNEVISKNISERHARALLSLTSDQQRKALQEITKNNYTVQQTELFVQETFKPEKKRKIKVKGKGFSRNVQIARNTILQAIGLIEKTNMEVSYKEDDKENEYVITIRIKK